MAELAGRIGDGFIGTGPDKEVLEAYRKAGGDGPRYGQVTVCWAATEAEARRTAHEWWPTAALHGEVSQELPNPAQFTDLVKDVTEDQVAKAIPCGPDAAVHLRRVREYIDAGYDHVYLHQVGPDQAGFLEFAEAELLPELAKTPAAVG
jgi:coenzyme F420-dependent glucose-6-phosphate dehydrogenase